MNAKGQIVNLPFGKVCMLVGISVLILVFNIGCVPVNSQTSGQPTMSVAVETEEVPATEVATPADDASMDTSKDELVPSGWLTTTSQQCGYAISYPPEMQVSEEGDYSKTISFIVPNPEESARNFIYVSEVPPDFQDEDPGVIYNYDPLETENLLSMQPGESKTVRDIPNVDVGFTYQRLPDRNINGYNSQAYENLKPWEFPNGTIEIRYYLFTGGCTYLVGAYMDATGSDLPGVISEELFDQIISTFRLGP